MPCVPELAAAYRDAEYVVFGNPELVLRIGEPSAHLDALLDDFGASGAAFLTAYNPGSERRSPEENRAAAAQLDQALADANYSRSPGEGRDPKGRWQAEPSVLAIGIPRDVAAALGRRFGQNAIVFIARGAAPELLFLEQLRLVLDTNVWLDWLVFADPCMAPIRAAQAAGRATIFIDDACAAELARVLARPLGRRTLDAAAQAEAMAEVRRLCSFLKNSSPSVLPRCRDPDDQKFLEAAAAAQADILITKDAALLELARRKLPFRIVQPQEFD